MAKFIPRLVNMSSVVRAQPRRGAGSPISRLLSRASRASTFHDVPQTESLVARYIVSYIPVNKFIIIMGRLSQLQCTRRVFVRSLRTKSLFNPTPPTPHPSNQKRTHSTFIIIIFLNLWIGQTRIFLVKRAEHFVQFCGQLAYDWSTSVISGWSSKQIGDSTFALQGSVLVRFDKHSFTSNTKILGPRTFHNSFQKKNRSCIIF